MSEPTKPAADPRRWRLPDELPKDDDGEIEGWMLGHPWGGDEPMFGSIWYEHETGIWFFDGGMLSEPVTCLAWRPVSPPDKPEWIK